MWHHDLVSMSFWSRLDSLLAACEVVIDRASGSHHPRFPTMVYPLNCGYLKTVTGGDGQPIDVWRGSLPDMSLVGIVCTVDSLKHDGEYELLPGCTAEEISAVKRLHTSEYTDRFVVLRPSKS